MKEAILLSASMRRGGMEPMEPGFFIILAFAFTFALRRFTRVKCKRKRKCKRKKMTLFPFLAFELAFAF